MTKVILAETVPAFVLFNSKYDPEQSFSSTPLFSL